MRILPHAIAAAATSRPLDQDQLFRDALTTHGHPRAGIGAALHAAALHASLSLGRTLGYGELIELLLDRTIEWGAVPQVELTPHGWIDAWRLNVETPFDQAWRNATKEITGLLSIAQKGMSGGALASEHATLREIGCTGVKTVGSGTASAVGAVYLASRSAANPRAGLLAAAYLPKADTDTLASMTGSLLGAFAGTEWMDHLHRQVQDSAYLSELAITPLQSHATPRTVPRVTKAITDRFLRSVENDADGQEMRFPDGRTVSIEARAALRSRSKSASVTAIYLRADDGQTLQVNRVHRGISQPKTSQDQTSLPLDERASEQTPSEIVRVGVKLDVAQLDVTRSFYEELIGMTPSRTGRSFVTLNEILALSASDSLPSAGPTRIALYLDVRHIDELWRRVEKSRTRVIDPLKGDRGRRRFRCLDPEGNVLEVREVD
jgi:predicted enzyme related to lactoylglutathione lyase